ncbi:MAG: fimbrial assembly protein [Terracidiphilus sp.]
MQIGINLATRPFTDLGPILKRLRIALGALAAAAILLGIGLHAIHQKADLARARDHSLDGQVAKIRQERQGFQAMMRQPENALVLERAGRLNQLFDEKAFSWTLAMEDLETVLPGGVQVTTLEPNRAPDGSITVKLRVAGPRDKAIELVQNLEHSRHFVEPRIVGESAEANAGTSDRMQPASASSRVNFDLLAEYAPPTTSEVAQGRKKTEPKAGQPAAESGESTTATGASSTPAGPGKRRVPYLGVPRPKAPVQPYKGVAR